MNPQPGKFRKTIVVEAMQWDGCNGQELADWMGEADVDLDDPLNPALVVHTLEGDLQAKPGTWIIRGARGEFYPCEAGIFAETYERVTIN